MASAQREASHVRASSLVREGYRSGSSAALAEGMDFAIPAAEVAAILDHELRARAAAEKMAGAMRGEI